ncbi:MAG TPA: methylated-DNA--[protein]-cysteine S-methyltransferase [Candidatus Limnocylindrales bacterium]|jgi:O-6-methylguanine DNA methyltransferase
MTPTTMHASGDGRRGENGEPTVPELAALRPSAPTDLVPTVLVRVGLADEYFTADAGVGPIFVAYNGRGVSATWLAEHPDAGSAFEDAFGARFGRTIRAAKRPESGVFSRVSKALVDGRSRGLTFDLRGLTPFATDVLEGARTIPPGEIRPYAWLAREVGRPKAVRAVGTALGHNPVPILIPCHRIVRSDGHIGDYAWGSAVKRLALAAEGLDPDAFEQLATHGERYVGSDTTHIVCLPTCRYAKRVMTRHRVPFASLDDAAAAGYRGCKVCRPA